MTLTQAAGARRATGSLRVKDEFGTTFHMAEFGVLQTTSGWASVTGRLAGRKPAHPCRLRRSRSTDRIR